jgi:hypothetical protein
LLQKLSPHYDTTIFAGRGRWALRCAITDFGRSAEFQKQPSGAVFGALTIEAEIIEPFTNEQMFALVRDIPGVELPPDEGGWTRFAARVDEWSNNLLAALGH